MFFRIYSVDTGKIDFLFMNHLFLYFQIKKIENNNILVDLEDGNFLIST